MTKEENVCVQTMETEQIAEANEGAAEGTRENNGSTVLGKFKDVDALVRAYGSLQAEFTRRSQRLKELERELEDFRQGQARVEHSGVEKLRKNAEARRAQAKKFDEFLADVGKQMETAAEEDANMLKAAEVGVDALEKETEITREPETAFAEGETVRESTVETATPSGIAETERTAEVRSAYDRKDEGGEDTSLPVAEEKVGLSSQAIYEQACRDENVRLRIIGEYLSSLGRAGVPLTVGNAGTVTSPPLKARSIGDAGNIALRYFKNQQNH